MIKKCAHTDAERRVDESYNGCILCDNEQLRGNLSLADEGLANYALEVERLTRWQTEAAQTQQAQLSLICKLESRLESSQAAAAVGEREVERLQMSLKRYEPVSLYNGHDIDWWKAEAERLRSALRGIMLDEAPLDRSTGVWLREQACEALGKQPNAHEPCEQRSESPALFNCGYDPTAHGWVIREGSREGLWIACFLREEDANSYVIPPHALRTPGAPRDAGSVPQEQLFRMMPLCTCTHQIDGSVIENPNCKLHGSAELPPSQRT